MPRSMIIVYGSSIFSLLRNFPTVPHSGCINLRPHQQCMRALFFPHFLQDLFSVNISMVAILTSVKTYLIVVLICISLIISNADHIFKCLFMNTLVCHCFIMSKKFLPCLILKICFLQEAFRFCILHLWTVSNNFFYIGLPVKCQRELVIAAILVLFLISRESFQYFTMKCEVCWKILTDMLYQIPSLLRKFSLMRIEFYDLLFLHQCE